MIIKISKTTLVYIYSCKNKISMEWATLKRVMLILTLLPFSVLGQDKVKFIAAGVTCSMCSNAIHKSLSIDSSIKEVNPNLQTQEWHLEYSAGTFKLETLKRKVEDAGFSLAKVWLNNQIIYENKKKKK